MSRFYNYGQIWLGSTGFNPTHVTVVLHGTTAGDNEILTATTDSINDGKAYTRGNVTPYCGDMPSCPEGESQEQVTGADGDTTVQIPVSDCGINLFCKVADSDRMTVTVTAQQVNPDGTPDGDLVTAQAIFVCHLNNKISGSCYSPAS